MIIAIEDKDGNTIGAVQAREDKKEENIYIFEKGGDISIADIDYDDIFDTNDMKIRIQLEV